MLLVSFLLVIIATIFLLAGLFLTSNDLTLIFISIGCSAVAGLMLVVAVLRSRPRSRPSPAYQGGGPAPAETATSEVSTSEVSTAGRPAAPQTADGEAVAGGEFPIAGYDNLEVVEVLPLLGDLEPAELERVRQREASGRAHPWILARVDALLEAEADTGEAEWASRWSSASDAGEAESEASSSGRSSEWAASDFPLESSGTDYDDIEIVRDFPIDRYDELRANEVLQLLGGLDSEDLKLVRETERAGKARTSVISRIDVLLARDLPVSRPAAARSSSARKTAPAKAPSKAAANLPIEGYDGLTVAQIAARLEGLSADELKRLRLYEKRHKARTGVIQRIESALRTR